MPDRVSTSTVSPIKSKIQKVMGEFKDGKLFSSSGDKITNPEQAIAISEGKRIKHEDNSVPLQEDVSSEQTKLLSIRNAVIREISKIGQEQFDSIADDMVLEIPDVMLFTTGNFKGIETTENDLKSKEIAAHELFVNTLFSTLISEDAIRPLLEAPVLLPSNRHRLTMTLPKE